jgi:hypothetical protein
MTRSARVTEKVDGGGPSARPGGGDAANAVPPAATSALAAAAAAAAPRVNVVRLITQSASCCGLARRDRSNVFMGIDAARARRDAWSLLDGLSPVDELT